MFGFGGGGFGGDRGGGFFPTPGGGRFDMQYRVYPVSFINKEDLEKGNRIVLPPSALDHLARLNISYPMMFEVTNPRTQQKTHCGVLEFIAEEGTCFIPLWMMCHLGLGGGEFVRIINTTLPKGHFVKLQPMTKDFLDIHDHRAVLENSLRNFATLTVGDVIAIYYNHHKYEIEIIETKPANAISIIETDVNVDFLPPKDYDEPQLPDPITVPADEPEVKPEETGFQVFGGGGARLDGKEVKPMEPEKPVVDEEDERPWLKRRVGGVRTEKPYSLQLEGHMTGKRIGEGQGHDLKKTFTGRGNVLES